MSVEDVQSVFDLLDELDCSEEEMKEYFAENGDDPSEVDFFTKEGYSIEDTTLAQKSKSSKSSKSKSSAAKSTSQVAGNIYVL